MLGLKNYLVDRCVGLPTEEDVWLGFEATLSQEAFRWLTRLNPIVPCGALPHPFCTDLDEHERAMQC